MVMPRLERFGEHIDDHQLDIATAMMARHRAVIIEDDRDVMAAVEKARALSRTLAPVSRSNSLAVAIRNELRRLENGTPRQGMLRRATVWGVSAFIGRLARPRTPPV